MAPAAALFAFALLAFAPLVAVASAGVPAVDGTCVGVEPGSTPPVGVYQCGPGTAAVAGAGKCIAIDPSSDPPIDIHDCSEPTLALP